MKCHPYLWLAPHLLRPSLLSCLNSRTVHKNLYAESVIICLYCCIWCDMICLVSTFLTHNSIVWIYGKAKNCGAQRKFLSSKNSTRIVSRLFFILFHFFLYSTSNLDEFSCDKLLALTHSLSVCFFLRNKRGFSCYRFCRL